MSSEVEKMGFVRPRVNPFPWIPSFQAGSVQKTSGQLEDESQGVKKRGVDY